MKYRKKSSLIEATQWFKNGDHPQDESKPVENSDKLSEGKVVGHFRSLDPLESMDPLNTAGNRYCPLCGNFLHRHGYLDGANGEEIVCPGDYVVTDRNGLYFRLSRGEFESQYEIYVRPPRHRIEMPISDREQRLQSRRHKGAWLGSDEEDRR